MEALWIVFVVAFGAFMLVTRFGNYRKARSAWQEFARRRGYEFEAGGAFRTQAVRGRAGDVSVTLDTFSRGSGKSRTTYTRLVVDPRGLVPGSIEIKKEGFAASIAKAFGGEDVETGDAAFDAAARVRGDSETILAALDDKTRRRIERALGAGVTISKGVLSWEAAGWFHDLDTLLYLESEMTALAQALSIPVGGIPGRLRENVERDSSPPMRRRCLETLLANYPDHEATAAAARAALGDRAAEVRAIAAESLRGEGDATLVAVALDDTAPGPVRARAIDAIGARFAPGTARPVVSRALDAPPGPARAAAIRWAGRLRCDGAAERLAAMVAARDGLDAATGEAIGSALGVLGDPRGERAAIALLSHEDASVRLAAVKALAKIGGRDAVEPLLPFSKSLLDFGDLKPAAAGAIRAIQSRLGGAERGALSMAEILKTDGALSTPESESGGLAVSRESDGEATAPKDPA